MEISAGKYYRLLQPQFPLAIGQGLLPDGIKIINKDAVILLKYGQVFKASETISLIGDAKPYQLLSVKFITENSNQFVEVK